MLSFPPSPSVRIFVARESVEGRRAQERVPRDAEGVVALVVREEEKDVWRPGRGRGWRGARGGDEARE